jgi:anti-anti-sigma factor
MDIVVEDKDGITRVGLAGRLDSKGAEAIEMKFIFATKKNDRVVVDLSDLEFMSSMGIRLLVTAAKGATRRGGKLVAVGANEMVAKVITTSGIDEIVPLIADWDGVQIALA